jgi:hypothetical protein
MLRTSIIHTHERELELLTRYEYADMCIVLSADSTSSTHKQPKQGVSTFPTYCRQHPREKGPAALITTLLDALLCSSLEAHSGWPAGLSSAQQDVCEMGSAQNLERHSWW